MLTMPRMSGSFVNFRRETVVCREKKVTAQLFVNV